MSSRIYTNVVTIGNTSIYQVTGDPNGVLQATRGSIAVDNAPIPNIWQNRDGNTTWAVIGGGGVSDPQVREYGETLITIQGRSDNTFAMIQRASTISAFDVIKRLDDCYNHCYFDVYLYSGGILSTTFTGLRFTSNAQLIAWVNANVPRDGFGGFIYTTRVRCYDQIDPLVEAPARIWASNSLYKRLVGTSERYYGARRHERAASILTQWSESADFLADLWEKVYGVPHPDVGAFDADSYQCFWFGGRKDNFYRCGYEATRITPTNQARRAVTPANAVVSALGNTYQFDTNGKPTICGLNPNGLVWNFYQFGMLPDEKPYFNEPRVLMNLGHAVALAFGMTYAGNRAILIKPMTIDSFWLPWIDEGAYRYEYLARYDMQGSPKIRVLSPAPSSYESGNVMGPWNLSHIKDGLYNHLLYGSGEKPGNVQFQVRDLATGLISPLSNARIRFFGRRRWFQLSAVVETTVAR